MNENLKCLSCGTTEGLDETCHCQQCAEMNAIEVHPIQAWLESERNYEAGAELFNKYGKNRNLKNFFFAKHSAHSKDKLVYELKKLVDEVAKEVAFKDMAAAAREEKDIQIKNIPAKLTEGFPPEAFEFLKQPDTIVEGIKEVLMTPAPTEPVIIKETILTQENKDIVKQTEAFPTYNLKVSLINQLSAVNTKRAKLGNSLEQLPSDQARAEAMSQIGDYEKEMTLIKSRIEHIEKEGMDLAPVLAGLPVPEKPEVKNITPENIRLELSNARSRVSKNKAKLTRAKGKKVEDLRTKLLQDEKLIKELESKLK